MSGKRRGTRKMYGSMMRLLLLIGVVVAITILTAIWPEKVSAYGAYSVHQYSIYKVLEGFPLANRQETYPGWNPYRIVFPPEPGWTVEFDIVHGAYDEDLADVIYGCDEGFGTCTTLNHFWSLDTSPWAHVKVGATGCPQSCRVNAFNKAIYLTAQALSYQHSGYIQNCFYSDEGDCHWSYRGYFYENMGRVAHLLQDQSVPAHAHEDFHPTSDDYEDAMDQWNQYFYWGSDDDQWVTPHLPPGATTPVGLIEIPEDVCTQLYANPTWAELWGHYFWKDYFEDLAWGEAAKPCATCGPMAYSPVTGLAVNPCSNKYGQGLAKIAYLFYTTNQYADYFDSEDESGDSVLTWFPGWIDYTEFDTLGIGRDPHVSIEGHYLYRYAMRATATLFKVFLEMTDFEPPSLYYSTTAGTMGNNGWFTSPVDGFVSILEYETQRSLPSGHGTFETWKQGDIVGEPQDLSAIYNPAQFDQSYSSDGIWNLRTTDLVGNSTVACNLRTSFTGEDDVVYLSICQIKIDQTAPTIVIGDPESRDYTRSEGFTITWTATDVTSGLASETALLDGSPVTNGAQVELIAFNPGAHILTVTAVDQAGNTTSESVAFQVVFVPPVAEDDNYTAKGGETLQVAAPGILGNDTDLNNLVMSAVLVSGPAHGDLTLNPDGSFEYTPGQYYFGADSFTYRANDGNFDSNLATVTFDVGKGGKLVCGEAVVRFGSVSLTIPAGVLSSCSYVSIVPVGDSAGPDDPKGVMPLGERYDIRIRRADGVYLQNFSPALQLCYNYAEELVLTTGIEPYQLQIWTSNGVDWQLLYLNKVDLANQQVCAPVSHLSYFGLFMPVNMPGTGFAPGVETRLSAQPVGKAYKDLGDLWLEIPRLGVQAAIVGVPLSGDGWDVSWLGDQAGWLEGTAFPTWAGNSSLTAHVYDAFGEPGPFVYLNWLWYGDKIIVHAWGQEYVYEVRSLQQVSADTVAPIMKHEEYSWLTLVTCRGYDESSDTYLYRIVVRAVQVEIR